MKEKDWLIAAGLIGVGTALFLLAKKKRAVTITGATLEKI